ncbi:MAG: sugar phosphate isomerase/epimerase [Armatimonadota bacterium]|jgi:sugar phosphate isomerase/epimerase
MKSRQIAAQLYTLRDYLKTPGDIAESLHKVRAMGYEAVQLSGLGPIDEVELVKILDGEGLACSSTHEDSQQMLDHPETIVEKLHKLGCKYTAYPYPSGIKFDTADNLNAFIAALNRAGKVFYDAGITFAYHNHHIEFLKIEGRLALDAIYQDTDPRYLQGEIDTYWVQAGGGDPVEWCKKLSGRLPLLHLKDYGITPDITPAFFEVGRGNLKWKEILETAEKGGTEWFIVEQDVCPGDPFESLKISLDYLKQNFCRG